MPEYFPEIPTIASQVQNRSAALTEVLVRLEDAEQAHVMLDRIGVPQELHPGGPRLSLTNRIAYLHGMLVSAKAVLAQRYYVENLTVRRSKGPRRCEVVYER